MDFGGRAHWVEQGADHPAVALEQAAHRCFGEQLDLAVQRAAQQAGDQGVAVDQLQAAAVPQQVAEMAQQAPGRVQR
ncbi:hypothetical protein D3C75_1068120 [compost metagenome]